MPNTRAIYAFTVGFGLLLSGIVFAGAGESRQVLNGDLLYTADASAPSESEALFQAEGRAVEMLAIECAFPPRSSKVYGQEVQKLGQWFHAEIRLGVSIADCEATRLALTSTQVTRLQNEPLLRLLKSYEQRRGPAAVAQKSRESEPELRFIFTSEESTSAERAIAKKAENREALRASLASDRRGE